MFKKILGCLSTIILLFLIGSQATQTFAQTCSTAPANLVSWYQGQDNALDFFGPNNGTIQGNVTFSTGYVGRTFTLGGNGDSSGNGDRVLVGNPANVQDFTIEAWIKRSSSTIVTNSPVGGFEGGTFFAYGLNGYGFVIQQSTNRIGLTNIGVSAVYSTATITDTNFHHIAVTKSGNQVTFYVDGVADAPITYNTTFSFTTNAAIGARGDSDARNAFFGSIDELSIYNRPLTATEIQAIVAADTAGKCVPPPQPCTSTPANVVSWYQGQNNAFDRQGINDGTLQNGATFAAGYVNRAFSLDGIDDRVRIPASSSLNVGMSGGLTIETWINPNNVINANKGAIAEYNNGTTIGSHLFINGSTPGLGGPGSVFANLSDINGTSHIISSPAGTVTANQWQHIAVTYDKASGNASVYRNGVQVGQANLGTFTPQTTYDLYLGARIAGPFGTAFFDGKLDEVSLYNRALSATEIQSIVAADTAGKCVPPTMFDFDNDGRTDLAVFRAMADPAIFDFAIRQSSDNSLLGYSWGLPGDKLAPGDYDGDGRTDVAVYRESQNRFYILRSSDGLVVQDNFGIAGDILTVGDWDGDGKDDVAVYREGTQSVFYFRGSNNNPNGNITFIPFGKNGDKPMRGDFDGDGKQDAAVFRPSNATWYILRSSDNQTTIINFGLATDKLVPADYDGDGRTDIAVYRNGVWYILQSITNQIRYENFGLATDRLVPADYDGDGKTDIAVYRNGIWYLMRSTAGFTAISFGQTGDIPIPNAYINP